MSNEAILNVVVLVMTVTAIVIAMAGSLTALWGRREWAQGAYAVVLCVCAVVILASASVAGFALRGWQREIACGVNAAGETCKDVAE